MCTAQNEFIDRKIWRAGRGAYSRIRKEYEGSGEKSWKISGVRCWAERASKGGQTPSENFRSSKSVNFFILFSASGTSPNPYSAKMNGIPAS